MSSLKLHKPHHHRQSQFLSNSFPPKTSRTPTKIALKANQRRKLSTTTIACSEETKQPKERRTFSSLEEQASFVDASGFICPSTDREFDAAYTGKLKQVRRELSITRDNPVEELVMIDAIQHLGVDYHFQDTIKKTLQRHHSRYLDDHHETQECPSLFEVSLRFRLLRTAGYFVSTGIFDNFKDREGNFRQTLLKDIKGLMSLHEASQISIDQGEDDTLDEANAFTRRVLSAWLDDNHGHLEAPAVKNTLRYTYRNSLSRFTSKDFVAICLQSTNYEWRHALEDLSNMESNMLQSIHKKEVQHVFKWWSELGSRNEMKLIRDQPLKWYMLSMGMIEDPKMSELRIQLTKPISLVYVIDDIFDIYGIDIYELALFTEAVVRWDFTIVERLPVHMKACFKALDGITTEIADRVYKDHGWNSIQLLRKTWAILCNAFLVEAKWFASKDSPKAEEYLKNGVVTSGVHVVLIHMFIMLGQGLAEKSADLIFNYDEGIMHSVATILRLWDDLGSAKDENQDGEDGSYIEFYMKENKGTSEETAREHVYQRISNTWKRLNKESLCSNPYSPAFIRGCLNAARMVPIVYSYDEDSSLPGLEQHMKSLLY